MSGIKAFLYGLLLVLCLTFFVVGGLGMNVLLDEQGTSYLSRSQFGQLYRRVIAYNPFFSALFFNGGLIGTIFSMMRLAELKKAAHQAAANEAPAAGGPSGTAPAEGKKDK